ncbi:MAG: hypothetical protein ACRD4M_03635 [Candidatus Acidiferrales bacterium]
MKRMRPVATAAVLFVPFFLAILATSTLHAQQASHPMGSHAPLNVIDGSKTPELIPVSSAYRLWLIAAAEDAADTSGGRLQARLGAAGLRDADANNTTKILAEFRTRYAQLIAEYNADATANHPNTNEGLARFLSDRDALVQNTRDDLKVALTPRGMADLDAHVQREKSRMKIVKGGL